MNPITTYRKIDDFGLRRVPRCGIYLGALIGLTLAFPVLSTEKTPTLADPADVRWCETGSRWHISLLVLFALLGGFLNAEQGPVYRGDVSPNENEDEEQEENGDEEHKNNTNGVQLPPQQQQQSIELTSAFDVSDQRHLLVGTSSSDHFLDDDDADADVLARSEDERAL